MGGSFITLGGRRFRPVVQGSVLHDEWVMARVVMSGIAGEAPLPAETPEDFAKRLLSALMVSRLLRELFGGMFVPEDVEDSAWTEELALETTTFLGTLSTPEDKASLQAFTLSVLVPFLESGFASRGSSAVSSPAPGNESSDTTCDHATTSGNGAH